MFINIILWWISPIRKQSIRHLINEPSVGYPNPFCDDVTTWPVATRHAPSCSQWKPFCPVVQTPDAHAHTKKNPRTITHCTLLNWSTLRYGVYGDISSHQKRGGVVGGATMILINIQLIFGVCYHSAASVLARVCNINDPYIQYTIAQYKRGKPRRMHTNKIDWQTLPFFLYLSFCLIRSFYPSVSSLPLSTVSITSFVGSPLRHFPFIFSIFNIALAGLRTLAAAQRACGSLACQFWWENV